MSEGSTDAERIVREAENKARREARQRKILENAKSRLEKLNGRVATAAKNGDIKTERVIYPDPEVEQEFFENLTAHETNHMTLPPLDFNLNAFGLNSNTGNIIDLLEQFSQQAENHQGATTQSNWQYQNRSAAPTPSRPDTLLTKVINTKVHIALISILTYFLFVTGNELYISYSVFFPLLLWEIAEMFLLRTHETTSSSFLIQILVLLTAVPPHYLIAITKAITTLNKIFKDVGVFVFFFTLYHLFYYTLLTTREFDGLGASLNVRQ